MRIRPEDFEYIKDLVRERAAIVLEPGKEYLVESRLDSMIRNEGFSNICSLMAYLRSPAGARLHHKVAEAMTTNETLFFRDIHPFEALRTEVIPKLIALRRHEMRLNIWCGAASTGQEPYCVAMLLRECIPNIAKWNINFIASDLSSEVLEKARNGRYSQLEVNRGLPPSYLAAYFRPVNGLWQISDEIKRMVDFRQLNLKEDIHPGQASDIVLLRNVMIYLDTETRARILNRLAKIMRRDGYLFLGATETIGFTTEAFQRLVIGKASCYRPVQM